LDVDLVVLGVVVIDPVSDLFRRTFFPCTRVDVWTETRSRAVNIVFETLIGSVVNRLSTSPTVSAWNVV